MNKLVKYGSLFILFMWVGIIFLFFASLNQNSFKFIVQEINFYQENPVPKISLYDDEKIIKNLDLACKPESFGYTEKETAFIFPDKKYPKCYRNDTDIMIDMNFDTNLFTMNCSGKFVLGTFEGGESLQEQVFSNLVQAYSEPVSLKSEEWAFASCENFILDNYEHVIYKLRKNQKSLERAKNSLKGKPINIIMLVVDSLSRRNFFRKLPNTVNFLNKNLSSDFSIFDYKLHHILGQNSDTHYMPTFFGDIFYQFQSKMAKEDPYYDDSLWKYLHERGFVTLFGMDYCGDILASFLGKKPKFDHIMGKFWCAANQMYGYSQSATKERCIGNKNAHEYLLDYFLQFSEAYKEVSRFSYIHLSTAHESTGTVISTLDDDLVGFLRKFLGFKEDSVLFLMGDHGMRYGNWHKTKNGAQEHKLPLFLIIPSNSVLAQIPESSSILKQNSNRLISKFDFHTTLLNLGNFPNEDKEEIKLKTSKRYRTYNLFSDIIPTDRKCEDIGISNHWCGCPHYEAIPTDNTMVKSLTMLIIRNLNLENLFKKSYKICKEMSIKDIIYIGKIEAKDYYSLKVIFTIKESETAIFEILLELSYQELPKRENEFFESKNAKYENFKFYKIKYIQRLDDYIDGCAELVLLRGLDPLYCICEND
ncbi:unnamed protein product [Blepharisma stoltei]|uniref:Uncharacterized protein n=1 Tax=Blepharisma stoltei TaxID=1481888 RepID=A0AAU9JE54_9CILI|nr:unnamed protein product [Blepharisma stoltei]